MPIMEKTSRRLAVFIKEKRQERGITQEQLASFAKIEYKHIQNLESSKRVNDPKLSTLIKLADAFEVSVCEIAAFLFRDS